MKKCWLCRSWIPHYQHEFVGLCIETEEFVFEDEYCNLFELRKLEGEFIWCSSCKREINAEDVEQHKSMGHKLFLAVFMDKDYREEIYEG
ncbi:MAG: hypothetical protein QW089_00085 [Archaeoglobaceae archaeon]